ncbi:pentraxin fusion protein-like, partial [Oculina patagonica]
PLACKSNFFPFHGGCFSVNTNNVISWQQALERCNREGGTLAKIKREGLRYAFSNMLEGMTPKPDNFYFGLKSRDGWMWIDGSLLNDSLWMPGYPSCNEQSLTCAVLAAGSPGIKNVNLDSLTHGSATQSSSALLPFDSFLAIDSSYTTCFRSKKETNPWWQVTLGKQLYVESVEINDKIDCCPRDIGRINITVSTSQTGLDPTCTGSLQYGKTQGYKVQCSPPARGSYVTVTLIGDNVTLVLCHVVVRTI